MTEKSAFPNVVPSGGIQHVEPGMTLRDYFAGQALVGQLSFSPRDSFDKYNRPDDVAEMAYKFADAMLKERGKMKGGAS